MTGISERWRRYRERLGDDRETIVGRYHVTLTRHLLRSEVRVWRDVRPALGGLIASNVLPDADAEAKYGEVVAELRARLP